VTSTPAAAAQRVVVLPTGGLEQALAEAGLIAGRPVVVLIGGAAKLGHSTTDLASVVRDGVIAVAQAEGATVVDGGTDSGVMALAGRARRELAATLPLVGVAPIGKVTAAGVPGAHGTTALEPNHSHQLLAAGEEWGSEAPSLINAARVIGARRPIVAVLVDGGPLALREALECAAQGWPLITLAGSGRTADVLADYARGSDDPGLSAAAHNALHIVELAAGPADLAELLRTLLRGKRPTAPRRAPSTAPTRIEYPPLYVAAAEAARLGQRNYKRLTALDLSMTLLALGLGFVISVGVATTAMSDDMRRTVDAAAVVLVATFFLLALLVKLFENSRPYDDDWFNGRAIAETAKSLSWRFMMRTPPFEGQAADGQLSSELAALLDSMREIRQADQRLPAEPRLIPAAMGEMRGRPLADRRELYLRQRLFEQAHWYRRRSAQHRQAARRWFWVAFACELLAVAAALSALAAVALGQTDDVEQALLRGMSLLAALAIAVIAWTQISRDDELARSYAAVLHELLLTAAAAEQATTEEALAQVVRDGEEALGRENQTWVANRTGFLEPPDFGGTD
jgi:hypothetical protein